MKLKEFADSLKQKMDAMALPDWTYSVKFDSNLMDSVHVRFADQPKEKWPNGIWHNANGFLLMIDERGRQRELGTGPYQMQVSTIYGLPRMVGKTGTLEQIEKHIMSYLTRLKNPPAPKPALTPDKVVESLLESNGAASFDDEAADNIDDYCVWVYAANQRQAEAAKAAVRSLMLDVEPTEEPLSEVSEELIAHVPQPVKDSPQASRLYFGPILFGDAEELHEHLRRIGIWSEIESVLD